MITMEHPLKMDVVGVPPFIHFNPQLVEQGYRMQTHLYKCP